MVTALKDRTQLEAIDRIPRSSACPRCGGFMFIEDDLYCIEDKCLNCGYSANARITNRTGGALSLTAAVELTPRPARRVYNR